MGDQQSDEAVFVYVTAPDQDCATHLARQAVEARLAACANILGTMTSVFRWEGEVQEDSEQALILKTRASCLDDLTALLTNLHPYDCPCIVSWPLGQGGNQAFLDWILAETRAP